MEGNFSDFEKYILQKIDLIDEKVTKIDKDIHGFKTKMKTWGVIISAGMTGLFQLVTSVFKDRV